MPSRNERIQMWLGRFQAAAEALGRDVAFMEVCGTHTMSAFRCGLHSLMPAGVKLLSGPGCPVCVTAQDDIDRMVAMGMRDAGERLTLCTYGDMLRVPGSTGSLEAARGQGADVRVIYSTMDAVRLAAACPRRQIVLAAVGFETTTPATAAAILAAKRQGLANFTVLASHKRVLPAMLALPTGTAQLGGFLCPGHVSVITGWRIYEQVADRWGLPCVIVGFEQEQMIEGLAILLEQVIGGRAEVVNLYPQAVTADGNQVAKSLINHVFKPTAVRWRGLGMLPESGLELREEFLEFDAARRFGLASDDPSRLTENDPPGCRCGQVITGQCTPRECSLFGSACTPVRPIGPCMVSSEGTCAAWFKYGDQA